jgi:glycosyltransferase involved in cell wall biosynthesis
VKVLFITYDFPPDSMGARRVEKFCEYLPDFRWEPLVLTVKAKRGVRDDTHSLEKLKSRGVKIFRSGSADPYRVSYVIKSMFGGGKGKKGGGAPPRQTGGFKKKIASFFRRWFFIPDDKCLWIPFAVMKGLKIIKREKPDIIITTSYPSSAHIVGLILNKLKKITWVTDFRDGWMENPVFYTPPTPVHRFIQERLEKKVAEKADLIIGVTKPITHYFALLSYEKEKCLTITNGYDPADFAGKEPLRAVPQEKFALLYSGTLFEPRSPEPLLEALRILLIDKPHLRNDVRLIFLSILSQKDLELIQQQGLKDIVKVVGYVPHDQCLRYQKGAEVLVQIISPHENAEIMMTQKVFEYLGAGRPILAIVPPGPCRDLVESVEAGRTVLNNDIIAIKNAIADFISEWCKRGLEGVPPEKITQFTRRKLTEQLAFALYRLYRKRMDNE